MSKTKEALAQPIDEPIKKAIKEEKVDINDMPLATLADYMRYNTEARKLNKKLKLNRYPIKPCPIELHPKEKVIVTSNEQPNNSVKVCLSNDMIDFKIELMPGKEYSLPRCVVDYIAEKGTPRYATKGNPDGTVTTYITHVEPRFSIRTIYKD